MEGKVRMSTEKFRIEQPLNKTIYGTEFCGPRVEGGSRLMLQLTQGHTWIELTQGSAEKLAFYLEAWLNRTTDHNIDWSGIGDPHTDEMVIKLPKGAEIVIKLPKDTK